MPNESPLLASLPSVRGSYRSYVPLAKTNWFNVGGAAEILFRPEDPEDLMVFLKNRPHHITTTILGVGSNLLVRDGGIRGVVIKLGRSFTHITSQHDRIIAGAAALSFNTASYAASKGISGLEFLSGIPGTIGGALAMNAGAYQHDTSSILLNAKAIDDSGNLHLLSPADIGYVYRGNTLPERMIFIEGTFQGTFDSEENIRQRMQAIAEARSDSQPIRSRTSGSTFKNPEGQKAWQLIDKAGCRGLTIGGAQVSEKHCNFFINNGTATASDIEQLGTEVIRRVKETTGYVLQWEVQIIGEKDNIIPTR